MFTAVAVLLLANQRVRCPAAASKLGQSNYRHIDYEAGSHPGRRLVDCLVKAADVPDGGGREAAKDGCSQGCRRMTPAKKLDDHRRCQASPIMPTEERA